jgi:hypothetical protein
MSKITYPLYYTNRDGMTIYTLFRHKDIFDIVDFAGILLYTNTDETKANAKMREYINSYKEW